MSAELREMITTACAASPGVRLNRVLRWLGVARSVWYARKQREPNRPGRKPKAVPEELAAAIRKLASEYPWWGYKRIAVVARRAGLGVSNKQVYKVMKAAGLLQKRRVRKAELYQAARLFELLPKGPNELWQSDVTHLHIPGHGWWYAVTVIDYYSRYLLACHFTPSYRAADVNAALDAARGEAERLHGPLTTTPFLVTDNGPSFLARAFRRHIDGDYAHVRIQYRTPTQLGLLERFHQTLKTEEVYWKLYASPGEARESLAVFRRRYNEVRPHWALIRPEGGDPITPTDVYVHGQVVQLPKWQGWAKAAREKLKKMTEDLHFPHPVEPSVQLAT
ncbi:MAG: IS3 family transposase [Gammaproteobacteria bacterium]|nr:IS3 family transposase [Gammaproteobacteria bacterium]